MGWHDMDGSDWVWMTTMMIIFWGVILAVAIVSIRRSGTDGSTPRDTPEDALQHRLARGEIEIDEYNERLAALRGASRQ